MDTYNGVYQREITFISFQLKMCILKNWYIIFSSFSINSILECYFQSFSFSNCSRHKLTITASVDILAQNVIIDKFEERTHNYQWQPQQLFIGHAHRFLVLFNSCVGRHFISSKL